MNPQPLEHESPPITTKPRLRNVCAIIQLYFSRILQFNQGNRYKAIQLHKKLLYLRQTIYGDDLILQPWWLWLFITAYRVKASNIVTFYVMIRQLNYDSYYVTK